MNDYNQLVLFGVLLWFFLTGLSINYYTWFYKAQRIHLELLRENFSKLGKFLFFDMNGKASNLSSLDLILISPQPFASFLGIIISLSFFYYLQIRNGYDFSDRNIIALNVLFFFIFLRALLIGQDLKRIVRAHKDAETAEALTSIPPEAADAKHKTDE
jgi:hypothetical protein